MKKCILLCLITNFALGIMAQDVIVCTSNDSIMARVLSVGESEITYYQWNDLQGPIYSISKNNVVDIYYENDSSDSFDFQDSAGSSTPNTSIMLLRYGNKYYYDRYALNMNKKETLAWLESQNCSAAYKQFRSGYITSNVGWGMIASGFALEIIGAACYRTKLVREDNVYHTYTYPEGPALITIGSIVTIASIPTIAVGYSKMHKAVHTYNACNIMGQTRPYWTIQASNNGLGIAYNF